MNVVERKLSRVGLLFKLLCLVSLLVVAKHFGDWVFAQLDFQVGPSTEPMLHRMIMTAVAVYVGLMALPFVPGIEIGLGLILMFGARIVPLIYLSTVAALILAFLLGRLIPQQTIVDLFEVMRFKRGRALLRQLQPLDGPGRLDFLVQHTSNRVMPFLLRHRYIALAVALNTPGNAIFGGGGGIGLVAGFSRFFTLPAYVLTVCLAVAPFPLLLLLTGA